MMVGRYWDELYCYVLNEFVKRWDGWALVAYDPIIFLQDYDDFSEICEWRNQEPENEYFDSLLLMRMFILSWSKPLQGTAAWLKGELLPTASYFKFTQPALQQLYSVFLQNNVSLQSQIDEVKAAEQRGSKKTLVLAAETVLDKYLNRCERLNRKFRGERRCWPEDDWFASSTLEKSLTWGSRKLRSTRDRNFDRQMAELFIAATVIKEFYPTSPLLHALAVIPLCFPVSYDYFEHYFQRDLQLFCLYQRGNLFLFEQMRNLAPEVFLFLCSKTTFSLSEGETLVCYFDEYYPSEDLIGCSHTKAEYLQCFRGLGLINPILEDMDTEGVR